LRDLGCKIAQGYYLSRPLPSDQLLEWFQSRRQGESEAA
jgi:EAL domain-containing protein (putative c-di-GMP-specific phosphodiesterase class I)